MNPILSVSKGLHYFTSLIFFFYLLNVPRIRILVITSFFSGHVTKFSYRSNWLSTILHYSGSGRNTDQFINEQYIIKKAAMSGELTVGKIRHL